MLYNTPFSRNIRVELTKMPEVFMEDKGIDIVYPWELYKKLLKKYSNSNFTAKDTKGTKER